MGYFGVIIPDRYVHVSALCPKIKCTRTRDAGIISLYDTEGSAMADGHIKRCPVCFNMLQFEIEYRGERRHFLLSDIDLDIISYISKIRMFKKRIDINGITEYLNIKRDAVDNTVRRLRKLKIIMSDHPGQGTVDTGHRRLNTWGKLIYIAYKNGCYARQADILREQGSNSTEYNKLI